MIKLENVLEIIKIAMTNNEKCNTCMERFPKRNIR